MLSLCDLPGQEWRAHEISAKVFRKWKGSRKNRDFNCFPLLVPYLLESKSCTCLERTVLGYIHQLWATGSWVFLQVPKTVGPLLPSHMNRSGLHPRNSGQEELWLLERGGRSQAHHSGCLLRRKASV